MTPLSDQQTLLIEHACSKLVLRAAAAVDTGNAADFAALFTHDGQLERPAAPVIAGREEIQASYASRPTDRITQHLVTNILVEVESPTRATAVSKVLLWTANASDTATRLGRPTSGPQVVGAFMDTFALAEDGWRIAHRVARFLIHTPN